MNPKLSVCVITYNHEEFIGKAIESFLMQKTSFPFEIIIGEDCSTDKTREICIGYQEKYPDKIRLLLPEKNIGMMNNLVNVINSSSSEYIAICEGDDYWTDPLKLQKQVDFLEGNKEYSICSHGTQILHHNSSKSSQVWFREWAKNGEATIEDLIKSGGAATCSLVFRNKIFGEFPDWFVKQRGADWSIQILCASKGKMKYFQDIMGTYRIHEGGTYSAAVNEAKKKNIDFVWYLYDNMDRIAEAMDKHFYYKYASLFNKIRNYNNLDTFSRYLIAGDFENSKKYFKKILPVIFSFPPKTIIIIFIKYFISMILPKKYALQVLNYNINKFEKLKIS